MNTPGNWSAGGLLLLIAGLTVITIVSRGFFLLSQRELPMPLWLERGLRYAPLAALGAVVVPEIFATRGVWVSTWADARLYAAAAGAAYYYWRRGILGTIVCGMAVLLPLRLGLGW